MKALDIVITPKGGIGFITETNDDGTKASVTFINSLNPKHEHNSWYTASELTVIDSIPRMLANAAAHPFGSGKNDVNKFFKI